MNSTFHARVGVALTNVTDSNARIKGTKREGGNGRQKRQTEGVGNEKKEKKRRRRKVGGKNDLK